jgi:hypothetical protein
MTTLVTIRDRQVLFDRLQQRRENLIQPAARAMFAQLRVERRGLLTQAITRDPAAHADLLFIDVDQWEAVIFAVWFGSTEEWYRDTVDEILDVAKQFDPAVLREISNNAAALRKMRTQAKISADRIAATTRTILQRDADVFDRQLRDSIRELYGNGPARTRASRIARREVLDATAMMQNEAAIATERQMLKEWLSVQDNDVRDTHAAADRAYRIGGSPGPIPIGEQFRVGGSFMAHPRDPAGDAGEVINCRCMQRFVPEARQSPTSRTVFR